MKKPHITNKNKYNKIKTRRFNTIFNITQKDGMFFSEKTKEIW
jgi:hypothetical protein